MGLTKVFFYKHSRSRINTRDRGAPNAIPHKTSVDCVLNVKCQS